MKYDLNDGTGIYYYNDGDKYDSEWKNDKTEGKGINVNNMMVNGKMIKEKEKEYIIVIMEINMMVNIKLI
jgi:hypothetical protein